MTMHCYIEPTCHMEIIAVHALARTKLIQTLKEESILRARGEEYAFVIKIMGKYTKKLGQKNVMILASIVVFNYL